MNQISCEIMKDLLPLYVDGICSDDTKLVVERHLKECVSCKKTYLQMVGEIRPYKEELEKDTISEGTTTTENIDEKNMQAEDSATQTDQETIRGIANQWKRGKQKSLFTGIAVMAIVAIVAFSAYLYAIGDRAVRTDEVQISNVSYLTNGNLFFTLEVEEGIHATDVGWYEWDGTAYIYLKTERSQIFNKEKTENEFGENTQDYSNWEFNVDLGGIQKIYYIESLGEYGLTEEKKLIWETGTFVDSASQENEVWAKTYDAWGNIQPGLLANTLYDCRNPYVGDMSANGKILTALKIVNVLGSFKNALQTTTQPYEYTLEFDAIVAEEDQEVFDEKMTDYAYCMLALIENLGEVHWTYSVEAAGVETEVTKTITVENASQAIGEDIKQFNASAAKVQELLYQIGLE